MSSAERRAKNEAFLNKNLALHEQETARKAALSMYMRIEETDASEDLKEILHSLAFKLGLEP